MYATTQPVLPHWTFSLVCLASRYREKSSFSSPRVPRPIAEGPRQLILNSLSVYRKSLAGCAGKSRNRSARQVPGFFPQKSASSLLAWLPPDITTEGAQLCRNPHILEISYNIKIPIHFPIPESLPISHLPQFKCAFEKNGQQNMEDPSKTFKSHKVMIKIQKTNELITHTYSVFLLCVFCPEHYKLHLTRNIFPHRGFPHCPAQCATERLMNIYWKNEGNKV